MGLPFFIASVIDADTMGTVPCQYLLVYHAVCQLIVVPSQRFSRFFWLTDCSFIVLHFYGFLIIYQIQISLQFKVLLTFSGINDHMF